MEEVWCDLHHLCIHFQSQKPWLAILITGVFLDWDWLLNGFESCSFELFCACMCVRMHVQEGREAVREREKCPAWPRLESEGIHAAH